MRAAVVVECNPVGNDARGVLNALDAMAMNAFVGKTVPRTVFYPASFLERSDDPLDHAVIRHDGGGVFGLGSAAIMASGAWGIGST